MTDSDILAIGKQTLIIERDALHRASELLNDSFVKAIALIYSCKGRIVVTGMGKSGHIAQKIAATLSSTGTPSFFMHPAEGVHGDLGMLVRGDVVIALSYSGETEEIKRVLPIIKRLELPLISIVGNINSTLAQKSDAVINGFIEKEACPMNLAPTSSTTVALALGDALAVALVEKRHFKAEDFALVHPSGTLGRKLLLTVQDLWHTADELPVITLKTSMKELLYTISSKRFGCTAVVDDEGKLIGIVTDGDLRRSMERYTTIDALPIDKIMSPNPKTIAPNELAAKALAIMQRHTITSLLSVDEMNRPVGIIHLHDLLKAGIA
ncbi:MAG: KpsF/GutQ family sugar-phosphate isomerase [Deferribacteraceae bacterium]|jgi:arabinose-5-phosphate isomerase|nr:KpsF/GutQ family sugar-phosphate isomerase [Deferribacteraceae bacterium]